MDSTKAVDMDLSNKTIRTIEKCGVPEGDLDLVLLFLEDGSVVTMTSMDLTVMLASMLRVGHSKKMLADSLGAAQETLPIFDPQSN